VPLSPLSALPCSLSPFLPHNHSSFLSLLSFSSFPAEHYWLLSGKSLVAAPLLQVSVVDSSVFSVP
ncbi:MAG: hypothetical protein LBK99_12185, partial [Opitutaceae bacterium]|nr:hypothetical protein [Opitutaceae bacterium]